jgi:hypothetical protein
MLHRLENFRRFLGGRPRRGAGAAATSCVFTSSAMPDSFGIPSALSDFPNSFFSTSHPRMSIDQHDDVLQLNVQLQTIQLMKSPMPIRFKPLVRLVLEIVKAFRVQFSMPSKLPQ